MARRLLARLALAAASGSSIGEASSGAGAVAAGPPPVVLVAGLTGSGIEASLTQASMPHSFCKTDTHGSWFRVWLDVAQLIPEEKDCFIARLQLTYNATDGSYANRPGVQLRPIDFGGIGGIDVLDPAISATVAYKAMIQHLQQALGYQVGKNLFGAPYDWRLAGDGHARVTNGVGGFYAQLQQLVEQAVQSTGQKAVLVTHSLGCPTTLYFLNKIVSESWAAAHVAGWVALAGPWLGSINQVTSYLGGNTLGLPMWLVPHDYVKPVQRNASSGVWLSPHPRAFGNVTIVTTPTRNYTSADIPGMIKTIGPEAGGDQTLAMFAKAPDDLLSVQRLPLSVPLLNWHSTGKKTVERLVYSNDLSFGFNEAPVDTFYGDGDGTVNLVSLTQPDLWDKPPRTSLTTRIFPGADHTQMLTDQRVLDALTEYLHGLASGPGRRGQMPMQAVVV